MFSFDLHPYIIGVHDPKDTKSMLHKTIHGYVTLIFSWEYISTYFCSISSTTKHLWRKFTMAAKCNIHWFRKGLRLHDNPALSAACEGTVDVRPIFILDPWFVKNARVGVNRWRFLIDALRNLDENLRKINSRWVWTIQSTEYGYFRYNNVSVV